MLIRPDPLRATAAMAGSVQEIQSDGLTWKCLPDLELGFDTYLEEFKSNLLSFVRPKWHLDSLQVKVFDGGISNKLVAIFDRERGFKNSREDVVLLRINGLGTSEFIDRKDEVVTMICLHRAGLVPPVYCQLKNGLCYGFMPGRALTVDDVRDERMMKRIIRTMTRLHSLEIPVHFRDRPPVVWQKMDNFLKIVPETFGDENKDKW